FYHSRQPSARPFPYTTLFRSQNPGRGIVRHGSSFPRDQTIKGRGGTGRRGRISAAREPLSPVPAGRASYTQAGLLTCAGGDGCRSEEHTSELQSRFELVCRPL